MIECAVALGWFFKFIFYYLLFILFFHLYLIFRIQEEREERYKRKKNDPGGFSDLDLPQSRRSRKAESSVCSSS